MEEAKKRGRPSLSSEERGKRTEARAVKSNEYHKISGYSAQTKYRQAHLEQYREYKEAARKRTYEPKIRIPIDKKEELSSLLQRENLSLTQLFAVLVLEKYGLDLFSNEK